MAIKICLLGRPGSGKSAAARYIQMFGEERDWSTKHINDYTYLKQMYQEDKEGKLFKQTECGGFDVVDFSVLEQVLHKVEEEAHKHCPCSNEFLLLEFARNDYKEALHSFSSAFLRDTYFLFLHADINICAQRVHERSTCPVTPDDHFISEEMLRNYYAADHTAEHVARLMQQLALEPSKVCVIENMGSRGEFCSAVQNFLEGVLACEKQRLTEAARLCALKQRVIVKHMEPVMHERVHSCQALQF